MSHGYPKILKSQLLPGSLTATTEGPARPAGYLIPVSRRRQSCHSQTHWHPDAPVGLRVVHLRQQARGQAGRPRSSESDSPRVFIVWSVKSKISLINFGQQNIANHVCTIFQHACNGGPVDGTLSKLQRLQIISLSPLGSLHLLQL